jgi:hypothetical protein
LRREIEQVKQRRSERESEVAAMEEMREQQARDYASDVVEGWEQKEEEFHLSQAKLRSEIRIKEGREKAIDILAKNLNLFHAANAPDANIPVDLDGIISALVHLTCAMLSHLRLLLMLIVELTEPYKIFDGLGIQDLDDLRRDLKMQLQFGSDLNYWESLMTICDEEVRKVSFIIFHLPCLHDVLTCMCCDI